MLDLALVGTGGMLPLPNRWLSSVLLRYGPHLVLFDCGEGTQISLRSIGWGIKNIDLVLISHVHGDHVTGLPGLLLTQGNSGRTEPLQIVGPSGLGPPVQDWKRLQRGEQVNGVSPADVLGPERRGLSVGLVTDTRPTEALA